MKYDLHTAGELAEKARSAGQRVVLAHGVFDIIHPGHITHLEEGKRCGDALFVTVTSDRYVGKGPDRPAFSQEVRCDALSALEAVDVVAVSDFGSAVPAIEAIKPDVYIKGEEYINSDNDLTGMIVDEQKTVEIYGGRIHYTSGAVDSSSRLINRFMPVNGGELRPIVQEVKELGGIDLIEEMFEAVGKMNVLLVGDTIFDEYRYVKPLGKPSKENILATQAVRSEVFMGGVIAAANHIVDMVSDVCVVTDGHGGVLPDSLIRKVYSVTLRGKATRKIRYVEEGYNRKLFEVYEMDDTPDETREKKLEEYVDVMIEDKDVVIITDFGHGLLTNNTRRIGDRAKFLAINTQANAGNFGYNTIGKYDLADYICLDEPEVRLHFGEKYGSLSDMAGKLGFTMVRNPEVIITKGRHGCHVGSQGRTIPALTQRVSDTMGAGDAFFAVSAPFLAAGCPPLIAAFIGAAAGALKVNIIGHRESITKATLLNYLKVLLK